MRTAKQLAEEFAVSPRAITRTGERIGVGRKPGVEWLYTDDEAAEIEANLRIFPGNPNFGKGNDETIEDSTGSGEPSGQGSD